MAPRLPQFTSGNLAHTAGVPSYDGGSDLTTGTSTANWHGDTSFAADLFNSATLAVFSDSQFSGGDERGLKSITTTFPIPASKWSSIGFTYGIGDPFYIGRSSPEQHYLSSQWHRTDTSTETTGTPANNLTTIGAAWTDNGITEPGEFPLSFAWINEEDATNLINVNPWKANDQGEVWYDTETIGNDGSGVGIQFNFPVLHGGSTSFGALTDFKTVASFYTPAGSLTSDTTDIDFPATGTAVHTLSAANGSAKLSMMSTDVIINGPSSVSYRPTIGFREDGATNANAINMFMGAGWVGFYESDGTTRRSGFGIPLVCSASGRNPEAWMGPEVDTGNANFVNHGGYAAGRWWMWYNFDNPDTLVYSFGHNSSTRDISAAQAKAESVFQADLFDLIYQHCNDHNDLYSRFPNIIIVIPWAAGSYMDQDRHDEMIGVVDALNAVGIKTLAIDLFNYWGGESFVDSAAPSDWTTATSFALDASVHPDSIDDARAAWYPFYTSVVEAAASVGSRTRDRSRER